MPSDFTLATNSTVIPISAQTVSGSNIGCQINATNNIFQVNNMFYSFGYNPIVDGSIIFNLTSIIAKNPMKTLSNQSLMIQTWEMVSPSNTTTAAIYGLVD